MTREEASKILRDMLPGPIVQPVHPGSQKQEAIRVALASLRGPTREMVERVRGEWECITDPYGKTEGFLCKCGCQSYSASNFCPSCGQSKTDEAVDIELKRWKEALKNERNNG